MEMSQDTPVTITLNGNPHPLPAAWTVAELLESLGFAGKPVVVELDERALFPREYSGTRLTDGCKVELVTLAAGG
jgi:thiamine biosynthesis protein ThiS